MKSEADGEEAPNLSWWGRLKRAYQRKRAEDDEYGRRIRAFYSGPRGSEHPGEPKTMWQKKHLENARDEERKLSRKKFQQSMKELADLERTWVKSLDKRLLGGQQVSKDEMDAFSSHARKFKEESEQIREQMNTAGGWEKAKSGPGYERICIECSGTGWRRIPFKCETDKNGNLRRERCPICGGHGIQRKSGS